VKESGLPAAIYRPGIVVGDSKTGVTAKFDGPYFSLNAMRLLPSPGIFMKVGTGEAPVNLVPVDFVLEAIARLSTWPGAIGKTYALADPAPSPRSRSRSFSRGASARPSSTPRFRSPSPS